jgi:dipeptidyl aminopeptidase/acylaminoacyl peptidase
MPVTPMTGKSGRFCPRGSGSPAPAAPSPTCNERRVDILRQMIALACSAWLTVVTPCAAADADAPEFEEGVMFGDEVGALALSPDGRLMATGHPGGVIQLRISAALEPDPLFTLRDVQTGDIRNVQFSREGRWLLSEGTKDGVRLWDLITRDSVLTLGRGPGGPSHATLSPDASLIAALQCEVGSNGGRCSCAIYSTEAGKRVSELKEPVGCDDDLRSLAYSPDGSLLAAAGADRRSKQLVVSVWSLRHGETVRILDTKAATGLLENPRETVGLAFSPDGKLLALAARDTETFVWNTEDWKIRARLNAATAVICFTRDSKTIAAPSRGQSDEVTLWDAKSGAATVRIPVFTSFVRSLAASSDGLNLFVGGASYNGWESSSAPPEAPGRQARRVSTRVLGGVVERIALQKLKNSGGTSPATKTKR